MSRYRARPSVLFIPVLLIATSCEDNPAKRVPATAIQAVVARSTDGGLRPLNGKMARSIRDALRRVLSMKSKGFSRAERAASKPPGELVGRWRILHTIHRTNGKAGAPARPIVPTEWVLTRDGRLKINGGMRINARYLRLPNKILVSGFGPKQVYEILKLSKKRLEVVARINAGSVRIANTTVLTRVGAGR